jgi:hypothetical protein
MVGFRVIDLGLLLVWLVWFFRLRDDDDDDGHEDDGGGGGPSVDPGNAPGGGGLGLPLDSVTPSKRRLRDHGRSRPQPRRRGGERALPGPAPARVRRPVSPLPAHHRSR